MNDPVLSALFDMFVVFDKPATDARAEGYARRLTDINPGAVCAAIERLILTSEWLPTLAAIRREVTTATLPHVETEDEAWALIRRCMAQPPGQPWELPPLVSKIMRLIGTSFDFRNDERGVMETRFRKAYAEERRTVLADIQAGAQVGEIDAPRPRAIS